jgi:hypothetical protein
MFPGCRYSDRRRALVIEEGADEYVRVLAGFVERARLNDYYPPTDALLASLGAMSSTTHAGLYDRIEVHAASGLPTYREFVRVASDHEVAAAELRRMKPWDGVSGAEIYERLERKRRYYASLTGIDAVMGESTRIHFRKIDPDTSMAMFRIVLDRFSADGLLERLTVELSQRSTVWGRRDLSLDDNDAVGMSDDLKGRVYRLSSQEVEFIFITLTDDEAVRVETVIKGSIGPFVFRGTAPAGPGALLEGATGGAPLLTVGLATASLEQMSDVDNDPVQVGTRLSSEAREEYNRAMGKEPFHVLRDRKFVVRQGHAGTLSSFLESRGTSNIIYEHGT